MDWHNEFKIQPGAYQYKGQEIVLTDLVTHTDSSDKLADPLVIYRDVIAPVEHVEGRPVRIHRRYAMDLKKWNRLTSEGLIKRI